MMNNKELQAAINALGAMIEIATFMYKTMMHYGFPQDEAYSVAHDFILTKLCPEEKENTEYDD